MLKNFEVLWIRAYIALVCALIAAEVKAQNLPLPPDIGGTSAQANDPLGYMVGAIRTLVLLGFLVVAVVGMMTYGGGMVAELNNARSRGEWGKFGVYTIAGLFVIVVIIFAGWWGANYLATALSSAAIGT